MSPGSSASTIRGSHASSTSKSPSVPSCSRRAVATPQLMFEPARLWTGVRPAWRRADASMPAVVVLPLVALITVEPEREARAQALDRVRRHAKEHAPRERCAAAAAGAPRQVAGRAGDRDLRPEPGARGGWRAHGAESGGTITRRALGRMRTVAGRSATGSPSA